MRSEISIIKDNSIPICHCQVAKIDSLDKEDINNVSQDTVALWQKIIRWGEYLPSERINTSDISNIFQTLYQNTLSKMLKPIFDDLEMSGFILTDIDENWLDQNPDLVVLYNII